MGLIIWLLIAFYGFGIRKYWPMGILLPIYAALIQSALILATERNGLSFLALAAQFAVNSILALAIFAGSHGMGKLTRRRRRSVDSE